MTKKRIPQNLQAWIDARKKYHLSHAQIQMARELGMNPRKFGGLANHRQERWKMPESKANGIWASDVENRGRLFFDNEENSIALHD